jgi:hypothetical protein
MILDRRKRGTRVQVFNGNNLFAKPKRSQLTIFIIIALVIIAAVVVYFVLRNSSASSVPENMKPVYDYYLSCLQENAMGGVTLLEQQGGYIVPPNFVPGSQYMPFSSQLDFFGQPVSYWMYVTGNNLLKEQVPLKSDMQEQLAKYVNDRVNSCDFSSFYEQGYVVSIGDVSSTSSKINNLNVDLDVKAPITISFDNQSVTISEHKFSVDSKLGKFYDLATSIYNFEKTNMFLESYALDTLRLYEPVTGVELTCAPKVFNDEQIRTSLAEALQENVGMLKLKGSYYSLSSKDNNYFVTDIGKSVDENVNFIYNSNMPTRIEIYGDKIAQPVGMQEGLGILGFCYVPYHLIYDVDFPVLIQLYDSNEMFQFPMAVIIDKTQARNALPTEAGTSIESPICTYYNQPIEIHTYNSQLAPIEADLKFKCLNTECSVGESQISNGDAVFHGNVPQCVNGFVIANALGYAESKYQISTNEESTANIVLSKLYNITLDLGDLKGGQALINFQSEDYSTTAMYPETKNVQLKEGSYNISVYVYKNSTIHILATSSQKCVKVPQSGVLGVLGGEKDQCFDVNLPAQDINFAIIGGGNTQDYLSESQLNSLGKLNINVPIFKTPTSLQEVQDNYNSLQDATVYTEVIS